MFKHGTKTTQLHSSRNFFIKYNTTPEIFDIISNMYKNCWSSCGWSSLPFPSHHHLMVNGGLVRYVVCAKVICMLVSTLFPWYATLTLTETGSYHTKFIHFLKLYDINIWAIHFIQTITIHDPLLNSKFKELVKKQIKLAPPSYPQSSYDFINFFIKGGFGIWNEKTKEWKNL